jgi:threonine/homoserine/homoserine lactone efflux protein
VDYSWSFLLVAVALVLTPGADFALIVRHSLSGGWRLGAMTTFGVSSAAALQGLLVTIGVAGVIVRVQPVFLAIKWAGVAYLAWLAFSLLRSAVRGDYADVGQARRPSAWAAYRRGFLCNATNPKILVFYLSLLPQFVSRDAPWPVWLVHAWTVPFLGTLWCLAVVTFVGTVRTWLQRRTVRRALDAMAGLVLLGFCARLAAES